jgi:hypothetical protein
MKSRTIFICLLLVGVMAGITAAETYYFTPALNKHRIKVVRKYRILVMPNQVNVAEIPAMFSFTGATNEQAIESSVFTFSVPPDMAQVRFRSYNQVARKVYHLVWKNPAAITIEVKQEMVVTLTARNKLCTQAKLPYSAEVYEKFKDYLYQSKDCDINPNNPALDSICPRMAQTIIHFTGNSESASISSSDSKNVVFGSYAELMVSKMCDWIADNLEWRKGEGCSADKALEQRYGNSYALSCVACSILRKMLIPCDVVRGTYVGGSNYYFIEVYYPDAGWVFYDVASPTRGFMTLDCVATACKDYCIQSDPKKDFEWVDGHFFDSWDIGKYVEPEAVMKKALRDTPAKKEALSVMVMHGPVPTGLPVRQEPLRNLALDPNTMPPLVVEKKALAEKEAFDSDKPKEAGGKRKE